MTCTCPYEVRPLGRLEGVNMGKALIRTSLKRDCPVHDPATHDFTDPYPDGPPPWHVPPRLCKLCNVPKGQHG